MPNLSGTISYIKTNLEGSTSSREEVVIKIVDSSECLFAITNSEYKEFFQENDVIDLDISSGTGVGQYHVEPYKMNEWDEKLLFSIIEDGENITIEVGTMGMMKIVLEEKKNVLQIPSSAVYKADGKSYVYVIDE